MIRVTRFNGSNIFLNAELIQSVEGTPDTVITLTNQIKVVVKDDPQTVVDAIIAYQQKVHTPFTRTGEK
ncbi:MAG: flagellar FlbD family protein [Anaerolineales bacterium]|nr:flagellar FlbD family protein [Anaerolineales bacterium]